MLKLVKEGDYLVLFLFFLLDMSSYKNNSFICIFFTMTKIGYKVYYLKSTLLLAEERREKNHKLLLTKITVTE